MKPHSTANHGGMGRRTRWKGMVMSEMPFIMMLLVGPYAPYFRFDDSCSRPRLFPILATTALVYSSRFASATSAQSAENEINLPDRVRGAILGALTADALTLGSHYEYDAKKIKQAYGGKPIDKLLGPGEHMGGMTHGIGWGARNYHPGKKAGDNTDYGDGNLFFLEYMAKSVKDGQHKKPFSIEHYVNTHWKQQYEGWQTGQCRGCKAWLDTMVRTVLSNLDRGIPLSQAGGVSNGQVVQPFSAPAIAPSAIPAGRQR